MGLFHKKKLPIRGAFFMERDEISSRSLSSPKGIRTPVASVKGRCPRPLDDGAKNVLGKFAQPSAPCEITGRTDPPSRLPAPIPDLGLARSAR